MARNNPYYYICILNIGNDPHYDPDPIHNHCGGGGLQALTYCLVKPLFLLDKKRSRIMLLSQWLLILLTVPVLFYIIFLYNALNQMGM